MVAIIGTGTLAQALSTRIPTELFGKDQIDFTSNITADVIDRLAKHATIINCSGISKGSISDILAINYFGPVRLIEQLMIHGYQGRLIMIGSHGASWYSWPGIGLERLIYNLSKNNLRDFIKGLAHSAATSLKLTIIEPTRFASHMNEYQGPDVAEVADAITELINHQSLLHAEFT